MQTGFGKKLFLGCLLATGVIPAMAADQAMQPVGIIGAPAGTFSQPNGGDWAKIAVNWLNWQLKDNAAAGKWFQGDDCGYCTDANWNVEFKPEG
jgi:hypothetical protein